MDLTHHVDETLRRWPGPFPAPAFSGWSDGAGRLRNAVRALIDSALAAHRARARRMQGLQQLRRLDDRLLIDIGVQPSDIRRPERIKLGPWLPNPWL